MNNVKYVVIHRRDYNNVGDMAANPLQYFLKPEEYLSIDISEWVVRDDIPHDAKIIVGGGGLISNDNFDNFLSVIAGGDKSQLLNLRKKSWILNDPQYSNIHKEFTRQFSDLLISTIEKFNILQSPKILWGAGHNSEPLKKGNTIDYPSYLNDFDLVGVRDYGQVYSWVPCASCMHPALTKTYEIKNDIIWFEHKKQLTKDFGDISMPRFVNSGNNIDQTIEILGSANIIVTNSYHGVYWGTLLGKKVILSDAWSSKFQQLKHKPYVLSKNEKLSEAIENVKIYPRALDECVSATIDFWNRVQKI